MNIYYFVPAKQPNSLLENNQQFMKLGNEAELILNVNKRLSEKALSYCQL